MIIKCPVCWWWCCWEWMITIIVLKNGETKRSEGRKKRRVMQGNITSKVEEFRPVWRTWVRRTKIREREEDYDWERRRDWNWERREKRWTLLRYGRLTWHEMPLLRCCRRKLQTEEGSRMNHEMKEKPSDDEQIPCKCFFIIIGELWYLLKRKKEQRTWECDMELRNKLKIINQLELVVILEYILF